MQLKKFRIVSPRDVQSVDNVYETLLLNLNHVISVKPIKMVVEDKVIEGYWIRTSNGKKYRATEIPKELMDLLGDSEERLNLGRNGLNADQSPAELLN